MVFIKIFKPTRLAWVVSALLLQSQPLLAETANQLPPVLVTGSTSVLPASELPPHSRVALPGSVQAEQTFTQQDIEALRPRDVFDLLETTLGMNVTRQGSRVNNFSSNRGGNVGFLVDGVYLTGTAVQRVVGDIPVGAIESIQFIRDASVLSILPVMGFGSRVSTPIQGVVVINTIRPSGTEDKTRLRASYASYDTWKGSGSFRQSWADGRLQLGGGYQRSESEGKSDWNMAYQTDTYTLNGGWKDSAFMAMASLYINRGEREIQRYIGVINDPNLSTLAKGELDSTLWKYDPRDTHVVALNLARYWNDRHTTALTYGRSKVDGERWTSPTATTGSYFEDWSTDLNLSHTIAGERNTFKAGAQRIGWYQANEGGSGRQEEIYGLFLTDEYRITPAWVIDGSLRADQKHISKGGDKYTSDGSTIQLSNDTWTDKGYLLALGSAWQIDSVWRVNGRYAWSSTPTPDTLATLNDASLPAERLHRLELGVNANLHPALNAAFTPFYYRVKDAKVAMSNANNITVYNPDTDAYENLSVYTTADAVTRKGFELSLSGRFAGNLLSYELGWSRFKDDSVKLGTNNVETPKNRYTARLNAQYGPWNGSLSALRVAEYCHFYSATFGSTCLTVPAFTTVNLNVSRKFNHGITLAVYGQNLTDEQYYTRHKTGAGAGAWDKSTGAFTDVGATYGIELGVEF